MTDAPLITAEAAAPAIARTGPAAFLLPFLRPGDAGSAVLGADSLTFAYNFKTLRIPFGGVEAFEIKNGLLGRAVRLRLKSGRETVSGLSQAQAEALAAGLENALAEWWRAYLKENREDFESVLNTAEQFAGLARYMRRSAFIDLQKNAARIAEKLPQTVPEQLPETDELRRVKAVLSFLKAPEDFRKLGNEAFVNKELEHSKTFFDRIEKQPLTDEQRRAVATDEDHNLVVAAAGSGKTSVIAAKTAWLIEKGLKSPSEILLLTFTNDAQKEMKQRLQKTSGAKVEARTFHALGRSIIGPASPLLEKPGDRFALFNLLKEITAGLFKNSEFSLVMQNWFQGHFAHYRSMMEFRTWGEYINYIRTNEIRALQGEQVKSFEECEIANFLFLNGIRYEYESPYGYDTRTLEKRQYKPDFYLPESRIYIEHFGISRSGKTAPFVPRREYRDGMKWKCKVHAEYGTRLIQTFSYEKTEGNLTANLADKLRAQGVKFSPVDSDDIFSTLEDIGRISSFIKLLAAFLQQFKSARLSSEDAAARAENPRDQAFLKVFSPVYEEYQNQLAQRGEIDFQDMIIRAADYIEEGRYLSPYSYILVDEFQDTSPDQVRLLQALLKSKPGAQLFAVGDDWQSIYRFNGSDSTVMQKFSDRFGASARTDLSRTFRCADEIAAAATKFVLDNPDQMQKQVSGQKAGKPCISIGLPDAETESGALLSEALNRIEKMHPPGENASVMVLGRYNKSKPLDIYSLAKAHPRFKIDFMTVHKSKGLEADYVVVVGLCSGKNAFPSEIEDDPILHMVRGKPEKHPNAEERRVFYVAVTRAKHHVFLLADGGQPSVFIKEILDGGYDVNVFGRRREDDVICPECKDGRLVRRVNKNNNSVFYGCSNYPYCRYTRRPCRQCQGGLPVASKDGFTCPKCGAQSRACPKCGGGQLVEIPRKDGSRFLGCSNYSLLDCRHTENLPTAPPQSAPPAARPMPPPG